MWANKSYRVSFLTPASVAAVIDEFQAEFGKVMIQRVRTIRQFEGVAN